VVVCRWRNSSGERLKTWESSAENPKTRQKKVRTYEQHVPRLLQVKKPGMRLETVDPLVCARFGVFELQV
jgi:hypothetical protein